jgi:glycosyltransferase involved in cell wall biosynthesis
VSWLKDWRYELELTQNEISLFGEFARASKPLIESMRFLYLHKGAKNKTSPNIYWVDQRRREIGCTLTTTETLDFLYESKVIDPADHYLEAFKIDVRSVQDDYDRFSVDGLDHRRNFLFLQKLEERLQLRRATPCVTNLAGYLNAPSGMGESARSMRRTLGQCGVGLRVMTLPHVRAEYDALPQSPYLFGWPASGASVSITVANADCADVVRVFLPRSYWAEKNIGYWVWETEELPIAFRKAEELFDEIWTPSSYSAQAISRTVNRAIRVVPHTPDFAALSKAASNRRRFGLPEKATLFGFMFDPESGLQRKNVEGLMRAFSAAFRKDDNCYLVLKVNGRTSGMFDYEMMRARTDNDRVLFYEQVLTRSDCYDFIASLDVYASLHRSEGFGLTCAEAMAIGIPVVASSYSGNVDFMSEENSLLVKTRVIETERAYGPYPAGTRWGEPDTEAAIFAFRSLRDRGRRVDIGRRGKESVQSQLSIDAVGSKATALISAVTGAPSVTRPGSQADSIPPEEGVYPDEPRNLIGSVGSRP